jgi:hypothetical protein
MNNQEKKTVNEIKSETVTIQDMIHSILELDKQVINIQTEIKVDKLDQNKDSRMLFLKNINDININTIIQFSFQAESQNKLSDKDWLKERLPHLVSSIDNYDDISKYAFNKNRHIFNQILDNLILNYFFEFETKVRSIVRSIENLENPYYNPKNKRKNQYLNGSESFGAISKGLFENYLEFNKEDYEVVGIFSAIRNTIHNSGFYFSQYLKNSDYTFRKINYVFAHGKPVSFFTMEMKFNLLKDLLTLFKKIINHEKIKKIEQVKDPVSEVKFE